MENTANYYANRVKVNHDIWIILLLVPRDACFVFNPLHPKSALTDFTLSNARRFYLSIWDPLGLKVGGAVASWLVRSTPERAVRVRALAEDIVLCSWARHFTLTVPLSTQVYKWVPANLMLGGGNPSRGE